MAVGVRVIAVLIAVLAVVTNARAEPLGTHVAPWAPTGEVVEAGKVRFATRWEALPRDRAAVDWSRAGRGGPPCGAELHPLGTVTTTLAALDRATPLAIHCQAGARSAIGASVLERMGFTDVVDLTAGYGGRTTG